MPSVTTEDVCACCSTKKCFEVWVAIWDCDTQEWSGPTVTERKCLAIAVADGWTKLEIGLTTCTYRVNVAYDPAHACTVDGDCTEALGDTTTPDLPFDGGEPDDCCVCVDVLGPFATSDYTQLTTDALGTLPAGRYRFRYVGDAMQFGHGVGDENWYVNGFGANGVTLVDDLDNLIADGPSTRTGYATKAACIAAHTGLYVEFILTVATHVNLKFFDVDYSGNNDGPPQFAICHMEPV